MVIGPEWDGALSADEAAAQFGVARRSPPVPAPEAVAVPAATAATRGPARLPPLSPAPLAFRRAGLGWRVAGLWLVALLAVQLAIVPAHEIGSTPALGDFVAAVAWRFARIAVPCLVVVAGLLRLVRGHWGSARGPLLALSAAYALLAAQYMLQPAPTIPVARVAMAAPAAPAPPSATKAVAPSPIADVAAPTSDAPPSPGAAVPSAPEASAAPASNATVAGPAPATRVVRVDPDPWHTRARTLYAAKDWQGLLAHAKAWTQELPRAPYAWLYLGLADERLGLRLDAVAANEQAYALAPDDVLVMSNLANTYIDIGEFRKGADVLERVLALTPRSHRALNDYGYAMSRLGEYDEAVDALERAVAIAPGYSLAWVNLVNTHQGAGYVDRARDAARRANGER
jgi:tetratricopeptide (TPR) repeat protein